MRPASYRPKSERAASWSATALLVLSGLAVGCDRDAADATARPKGNEPRAVRIVRADSGTLQRTVSATGALAAVDQVVLNTKVAGRLAELPVDLGSPVRQGDVVAVLDLTDFELRVEEAATALAQARARLGVPLDGAADQVDPAKTALVRQARAVLEQARRNHDRLTSLHDDGILSKSELDQADADFRVADARVQEAFEEVRSRQALLAERRAALRLAEQELADATLRAPFDGVVRERHLSIGGYLQVGAPVATIVRVHPLRLRLAVPEREAGSVRAGQVVRMRPESDGQNPKTTAEGTIVRLSPAVDEHTRTVLVEAEVPNEDGALRPGGFASAEIVVEAEQPAILVPTSAVTTFAGVTKVFGIADGRVIEKRVRVGRRAGERIEVTDGLGAGEEIIAEPGSLAAGQAVVAE